MSESDADRNPVELLAEEFTEKCRQGSCPSVTQYVTQFPRYAREIRELFPSIAMIEQLGRKERSDRDTQSQANGPWVPDIKRLGDFRVIREIGRGGMGVVYEAMQESLGRRVALKVLSAQAVASPNQLKRFHREAKAAAQLHHTNIVPVFGVGSDEGLHYYVMQFIDGSGLEKVLEQQQNESDTPRRSTDPTLAASCVSGDAGPSTVSPYEGHWNNVARIGVQLAGAVAYAHRQGVLHRDIKPANVLLDTHGTVWITDFGLAKLFDDEALTQSGDVVGTLRYMAPEQFNGESTIATDIYSLGLTLFELATRRPAFDASNQNDLIRRITQHGPNRPSVTDPAIPRDLDTIITKCTAFEAADRYVSAGQLADDLQRLIDGEPITARRVCGAERIWRWSRRNPAIAALSGLSFGLLVLVVVVISLAYLRVDEERRKAVSLAESEANAALEADQAKEAAVSEKHRAEIEFERAEGNLQLAISAFDDIIERVSSRGVPASIEIGLVEDEPVVDPTIVTAADVELLQGLLKFYVAFAERNGADQVIQAETAEAYEGIGKIYQRLGEFREAVTAYDRALDIYDQLMKNANPFDDFRLAAVAVLNQRGVVQRKAGRTLDAMNDHLDAKERLLDFSESHRDSLSYQFALAETFNHLGTVRSVFPHAGGAPVPVAARWLRGLGGRGGGMRRRGPPWLEDHRSAALEILLNLVSEDPRNVEYRLTLARSYRICLTTAWRGDHMDEVENYLDKAIELLEQLRQEYPNDPRFLFELADVLSVVIPVSGTDGRAQTDERLERAISIARQLVETSPNQPDYLALLANSVSTQGALYARRGEWEEAQRSMEEALSYLRGLVEQHRNIPAYTALFARTSVELGRLLRNNGSSKRSRVVLENGLRVLEPADDEQGETHRARGHFAFLNFELAQTLKTLGENALAEQVLSANRPR